MDESIAAITSQMKASASFNEETVRADDCSRLVRQFYSTKRWDRYRQLKWMLPIAIGLLVLLAYVANFSLWSPFGSVIGSVLLLFSKRFWVAAFLQLLVVSALWFTLANYVFRVTYESNVNVCKRDNWLASTAIFASHVLNSLLLAFWYPINTPIWFSSGSFIALWLVCTAFSSLSSGFQSNFAYHFPESSRRRHDPNGSGRLWRWLQRAAQVPTEVCKQLVVPAQHHLTRSAWIVCDAWLATLALAIVFKLLRGSWHNLLLLHHLVGFFALVFCQQLMVAALVQLVNSSYMSKVVEFPLPATSYSADGLRIFYSLPTALLCVDPVVKLFAMRYLRDVCCSSAESRRRLFELSEPGHHPRNWLALRTAAAYFINDLLRYRLDAARRAQGEAPLLDLTNASTDSLFSSLSGGDGNIDDGNSEASLTTAGGGIKLQVSLESRIRIQKLMFPPTLYSRTALFTQAKNGGYPSWMWWFRMPSFVKTLFGSACGAVLEPSPLVPTFEMSCALYVYEALQVVMAQREEEDTYGAMMIYPLELDGKVVCLLRRVGELASQRRVATGLSGVLPWSGGGVGEKFVTQEDIQAALEEHFN